MGLRGPAPKPTVLKRAAGNPGRRQLNDDEPIPPAGDVAPPAWLDGTALEIWHQLSPVLVTMRTLTTADVLTFARYCDLFARYLVLRKGLWSKGMGGTSWTRKGADGKAQYVQELPQASELRQLLYSMQALEDRFGLSASARSRIKVQLTAPPAPIAARDPAQAEKDEALRKLFSGGGPAKPRKVAGSE